MSPEVLILAQGEINSPLSCGVSFCSLDILNLNIYQPGILGARGKTWYNSSMGNFGRDDNRGGGYRGGSGFSRGGSRGGFGGGGRSSFGGSRGGDREMFSTVCSNCQKECQVPFKPTNGKPVYCSDCFEKMGGRNDRPSNDRYPSNDRPRFDDRAPRAPQSQGPDLNAINAKLDKILSILEPKVVKTPEVKPEPKTVKVAEVVDLPKIKKAVKKVASKKKE